jgi:steroid delta-isomerase-like uncharacterized protein
MANEENKALARRAFEEVINKGNLGLLDTIVAPSFVSHRGQEEVQGIEGIREQIQLYRSAFADFRITVEDQIAEGDVVVTRWSATGTHRGDLQGIPPTGKRVTVAGLTMDRIVNGKIVEEWEQFDQVGILQQLGVIPAPTAAR